MVMSQTSKDPIENLKKIHEQFPQSKIILVHGANWDKIPGEEFIRKIKGEVVRFPYYFKLSDKNVREGVTKKSESKK